MPLVEVNWHPNRKQLRDFGRVALIATSGISLFLYALKGLAIHWVAAIFGAGFVIYITSIISAKSTRIIYLSLTFLTLPIGWAVSFILLATFYFLLLTPLGLVFRLVGRDPLCRRFEPNAKTYWLKRQPPKNPERYFQQF